MVGLIDLKCSYIQSLIKSAPALTNTMNPILPNNLPVSHTLKQGAVC